MIVNISKDYEDYRSIRLISLVIVICFNLFLSVFFAIGKFSKSPQIFPLCLENRVNLNVAPLASLVRLPGIGRSKADAIISYRQKAFSSGQNAKVFKDAADLDNVSGIGPKTVENIQKLLKFE